MVIQKQFSRFFHNAFLAVITSLVSMTCGGRQADCLSSKLGQSEVDVSAINETTIHCIAESTTVLISGRGFIVGSGVLVSGSDINMFSHHFEQELEITPDKAYILTSGHVVGIAPGKLEEPYKVVTPDSKTYKIDYLEDIYKARYLDIAIIEFDSKKAYPSVVLGAKPQVEETVYVAGWKDCKEEKIFEFNKGQIQKMKEVFKESSVNLLDSPKDSINLKYSKIDYAEGYRLQYSNYTIRGMSGGPVFNVSGDLIAIHGKPGKYKSYQYNNCPSLNEEQSENWGILINTLKNN